MAVHLATYQIVTDIQTEGSIRMIYCEDQCHGWDMYCNIRYTCTLSLLHSRRPLHYFQSIVSGKCTALNDQFQITAC